MANMTSYLWKASHQLAAELAQLNCDPNLIREAESFIKLYPDVDLLDWLSRLNRLGHVFSSSNKTIDYRHKLNKVCERLHPKPRNGAEWALVLGWAGRLHHYYSTHQQEARNISNVTGLSLGPLPEHWIPPVEENLPSEEDLIPEVREEVSSDAMKFWEMLNKK